jgi:hypothetical protein
VSCLLHFAGSLVGLVWGLWFAALPAGDTVRIVEISTAVSPVEPDPSVLVLPWTPEGPTVAEMAAGEIDRLSAEAIPPELHAELLDSTHRLDPNSASGQWVAARMLDEVARAEHLSKEDQLARLKILTGQLNRIANDDSVAAATGRLAELLGTEDRAEQPAAEPAPGEFDFDTAQVHDVKRSEREPGQFDYVAILLDANGRTLATPLSPAEGEQLYKVMELVKSNPLLERIYRGVAMALLDKLLKPAPVPMGQSDEGP